MTARLDVTPKTTERNQIVRTNKSETKVTNNKKLRSRYCIIEAKKHTDRPETSRGLCNSRATCFIISYFGFAFTNAYNSILLCCLRRNVEPCCHTHDSWSTVPLHQCHIASKQASKHINLSNDRLPKKPLAQQCRQPIVTAQTVNNAHKEQKTYILATPHRHNITVINAKEQQ